MKTYLLLILIAVLANLGLNLCLKAGAKALRTSAGAGELLWSILFNPWFWAAGISAVALLAAFITAIRSYPLSLTYTAVTALAMVSLTVLGGIMQWEHIGLMRSIGLGLIVAGLVISALAA